MIQKSITQDTLEFAFFNINVILLQTDQVAKKISEQIKEEEQEEMDEDDDEEGDCGKIVGDNKNALEKKGSLGGFIQGKINIMILT